MRLIYEVQTNTFADGWVNCWNEEFEGESIPITFDSASMAEAELEDFFHSMKDAGMDYDIADYRIVGVVDENS